MDQWEGNALMASNIKAIFFDVDGTTYQHNIHAVPKSTMAALHELKKKGIKLAVCTSRVEGEMIHIPDEYMNLMDAVICSGGALTKIKGDIFEEHLLDKQDAETLLRYCEEHHITVRWADDQGACFFDKWHQKEEEDLFYYLYLMIPGEQRYKDEDLIQLLFYPDDEQFDEICSLLHHSHLIKLRKSCECTALGINKASGIRRLAEHWGIAMEETMAFGDGANDIPMLETAGIGVAMGNSHNDEVRNSADYITTSIEEDGVYRALVHFGVIDPVEIEE